MPGSYPDSRSSAECTREILDDWNLGAGVDGLAADPEQPEQEERAAGEDPSVSKNLTGSGPVAPHFSWELLDRVPGTPYLSLPLSGRLGRGSPPSNGVVPAPESLKWESLAARVVAAASIPRWRGGMEGDQRTSGNVQTLILSP